MDHEMDMDIVLSHHSRENIKIKSPVTRKISRRRLYLNISNSNAMSSESKSPTTREAGATAAEEKEIDKQTPNNTWSENYLKIIELLPQHSLLQVTKWLFWIALSQVDLTGEQ